VSNGKKRTSVVYGRRLFLHPIPSVGLGIRQRVTTWWIPPCQFRDIACGVRRPYGGMKQLSKRHWLFVALAAFVWSGTLFVVLYWLHLMGW
jgi:hypothetical protein